MTRRPGATGTIRVVPRRGPLLPLTAALLLAAPAPAQACSIVPDVERRVDVVLVGAVERVAPSSAVGVRATLKVAGVRRGDRGLIGEQVDVFSPPGPLGGGNCAVGFERGRTYVVYANEADGRLVALPVSKKVRRDAEPYVEQVAEGPKAVALSTRATTTVPEAVLRPVEERVPWWWWPLALCGAAVAAGVAFLKGRQDGR